MCFGIGEIVLADERSSQKCVQVKNLPVMRQLALPDVEAFLGPFFRVLKLLEVEEGKTQRSKRLDQREIIYRRSPLRFFDSVSQDPLCILQLSFISEYIGQV